MRLRKSMPFAIARYPASFGCRWSLDILACLTAEPDLDRSPRALGALQRRPAIRDGATLFHLALACGPGR
ncbi:hypothetical protein [Acetobacter aceti]|uniref:hypothetical protein n=1 Tax=Acetobacter aceti TaxID=435 RepID=UPI0011EA5436